jgi:COP9 signalosome complex subunit 3
MLTTVQILSPSVNSIAYAFALRQRIHAVVDKRTVPDTLQPGGELWNKLVLWLETFDPVQIRYAGTEWKKLVDFVEQIARATGSPGLAIAPMRSAMMRLDPTTGTFTSFHLSFIQLCMETRSYAAAEPILNNYIHSLPTKIPASVREGLEYSVPCADVATSGEYIHQGSGHTDKVTLTDLQEYYLLGAMAYLGLRQFKKARNLLEYILIAPSANAANGLMLEAYKKWVLVSCLVDSTVCIMFHGTHGMSNTDQDGITPRTANSNAIKQVKSASKAYEALAEAYTQLGNFPKLKAQIKAGADTWAEVSSETWRFAHVSLAGAYPFSRTVTRVS